MRGCVLIFLINEIIYGRDFRRPWPVLIYIILLFDCTYLTFIYKHIIYLFFYIGYEDIFTSILKRNHLYKFNFKKMSKNIYLTINIKV